MKIKLTPAESAIDAMRKIEGLQARRDELVKLHRNANGAQRMLIIGKIADITEQIQAIRDNVVQTQGRYHAS